MPELAVTTQQLRKVYGTTPAVASLDLTVPTGEIFGFLGPNGAGKSTCVKMLLGLVFATEGSGTLLGAPLGDHRIKARIGFLPEQFRFHEWFTAREFLDFHGQLYGMNAKQRKRRIADVLALVNLERAAAQQLRTFSKGMLQRIGIAQALLHDPELVFLDEPTSALDPIGRRLVRDIIRQLKAEKKTVFLNSHLLSEVEAVCDRVAIIQRGEVVRDGTLDELLAARRLLDVQAQGMSEDVLERVKARWELAAYEDNRLTLALTDPDDVPHVVSMLVTAGAAVHHVALRHESLEDLFVRTVDDTGA